jgi:predicted peroxiredoxin
MSSRTALRSLMMTGLVVVLASWGQAVQAQQESPRDGVFLHVSHGVDDPHRVLMALKMAEVMAGSRDVLVYFDIQGIQVVLKNAPDFSFSPFPASKPQLEKLIGMGIPLYACPSCLKAAGKTPADLMPGVKVADKDAFFSFTKGRILTLDY